MDTDATFDSLGLHPVLRRGVAALGFTRPTPIQAAFVSPTLTGKDAIGLAPTGTGKTLAYLLPVAHQLLSEPPRIETLRKRHARKSAGRVDPRTRLRAIVLCPTRELAQQVAKDARALCKGSLLKVAAVWGKSPLAPQREMIEAGVDLLAGTPGRVRELLDLDALSLAYVRHVIVDEADRMLDLGFLPQVERILERMPPERQILFLTATFPPAIGSITAKFLRDPLRLESEGHTKPASHVHQALYRVEDSFKVALTLALVSDGPRRGVLVFARTRRRAGWIAAALRKHHIATGLLHGDRSQTQREKALEDFAEGRSAVLVATDIAARGLHIPAIRTVINYDVPLLPEEYVHRVGRAGHGGGFAESFTFLSPEPEESGRWRAIAELASLDLAPTAAPDLTRWLRPEDRERLDRSIERAARTVRAAEDRERKAVIEEAEAAERQRKRKKTTKRAGKRPNTLRGGARNKPLPSKERPGSGVKRITPR